MERDSILYKIRRKCQVIASKLISHEFLSKIYYYILLRKKLHLKEPKTFNEKLQWLKLYSFPKNPLVVKCADKYAVRDYVKAKGLENILNNLYGVWDDANNICWDKLPSRFVLKCNHGCAYNILCSDKTKLNKSETIRQLNEWLKEDFGQYNLEFHYSEIKQHSIICEEYLGDCITDYKFFCFNGEPKVMYVSSDLIHDRQAQIGFYYIDGRKYPLTRDDYKNLEISKLPDFFDDMLRDARILSKDFKFVRVDFFIANNRYYFAELTFTPSACMMPFNPSFYDDIWGDLIKLDRTADRQGNNCE